MGSRLNVVHGHFAAKLLGTAIPLRQGELLVHDDVLSCGPLLPCETIEEWRRTRRTFWDTVGASGESSSDASDVDLLLDVVRLRDAEAIVLWIGTGCSDQLLLAWMVRLLDLAGGSARGRLEVVQLTRIGEREQEAWSLGLLRPEQLAAHPPPEPVTSDAVSELERCWTAITSSEPSPLIAFLAESSPHVPYLRPSLRRMLERYPDRRTGLGRWDAELLKYAQEQGPSAARIVGYTMAFNLDADLVGDGYLLSRLRCLADPALRHPLVTLAGDVMTLRGCEVALTEAGTAVLAGSANAVALNGIDDWVLGVHLDSGTGAVWHRDGDELVREASRSAR